MSLIVTYSTLCIFFVDDVEQWLPTLRDSTQQDDEFCPFFEPHRVILEPTCRHLLYRRDITEYLSEVSLLPCDILLELDREVLVFLDALEVLIDRANESTRLDLCLLCKTFRTRIIGTEAIDHILRLLTVGIEGFGILIEFTLEYPWDIDRNFFLGYRDKWELADELVCGADRRESSLSGRLEVIKCSCRTRLGVLIIGLSGSSSYISRAIFIV